MMSGRLCQRLLWVTRWVLDTGPCCVVRRVFVGQYLWLEGSWFLDRVDMGAKQQICTGTEHGNAIAGAVLLDPLGASLLAVA